MYVLVRWHTLSAIQCQEGAVAGPAVPIYSFKERVKKKKNVAPTIDTLPQTHIHTTLTSTPLPLFSFLSPTTPNSPSPSSAIVCIDTFQRRDLCAVALRWRAAFVLLWQGERQVLPVFVAHSDGDSLPLTCVKVKQPFNASTISPPFAASFFYVYCTR